MNSPAAYTTAARAVRISGVVREHREGDRCKHHTGAGPGGGGTVPVAAKYDTEYLCAQQHIRATRESAMSARRSLQSPPPLPPFRHRRHFRRVIPSPSHHSARTNSRRWQSATAGLPAAALGRGMGRASSVGQRAAHLCSLARSGQPMPVHCDQDERAHDLRQQQHPAVMSPTAVTVRTAKIEGSNA